MRIINADAIPYLDLTDEAGNIFQAATKHMIDNVAELEAFKTGGAFLKTLDVPEEAALYEFGVYEVVDKDVYRFVSVATNGFDAERIAKERCKNPIIFHNVRIQGIKTS